MLLESIDAGMYDSEYGRIFEGDERWRGLPVPEGELFAWDPDSTYVREATFFEHDADLSDIVERACSRSWVTRSRPTTSPPPGAFASGTPAGRY